MCYTDFMDIIQKFHTDIRKTAKYGRSEGRTYQAETVCTEIAHRFVSLFADLGSLPESIADYWLQNKIPESAQPENEPSEQNLLWLVTAADILNGSCTDEADDMFTEKDWKELCGLVTAEAEELPIDVLTDLMSFFMSKNLL